MTRSDSVRAALVASIWGFNFVVIQWGMHDVPPLLFAAIRFIVVLLPAIFIVPKPDVPWRTIAGVGTFMSLGQFGFLYASMHAGLSPGLAALILQAQVVFTILIAAGWLREIPHRGQIVGVLCGVIGLLLVGAGRGGDSTLPALLLCLLGALSWGIGNVVSRSSGVRGGLSLTVWSALVVPAPLLLLSLLLDGPTEIGNALAGFGWQAVLSTLYTACLASLLGYTIFNNLLSRYPGSVVVPWVLLAPIVAMLTSWLLLSQRPNSAEVGGGLILLVGVLIAVTPTRSGGTGPAQRSAELATGCASTEPGSENVGAKS